MPKNKLDLSIKQILRKHFDLKNSKQLRNLAIGAAAKKMEGAKKKMLQEFEEHEVTKSIENKTNTSLLGGEANMFEFLGFEQGSNPIEVVRKQLSSFKVSRTPVVKVTNAYEIYYEFRVSYTSLDDIYSNTPLPWGGGRSWVKAVETGGVSNFNYTLRKINSGRSGTAIQSKNITRNFNYKPTGYITDIMNKFRNDIK